MRGDGRGTEGKMYLNELKDFEGDMGIDGLPVPLNSAAPRYQRKKLRERGVSRNLILTRYT
jgi:hypothetical protein